MSSIRAISLHVDRFRGRRAALLRLLRDTAPDVACLHRVPRHPLSSTRLGLLASDTGMVVAGGGRLSAGAAVLTTLRVDVQEAVVHKGAGGGLVLAPGRLLDGQRFQVATLDPRGDVADQQALAAHLLALLGAGRGPAVVASPLGTGVPVHEMLATELVDLTPDAPATTPAQQPRTREHGLLGRGVHARLLPLPGAIGERPELLATVAVHRPVLVEVTLGRGTRETLG